MRFKHTLGAAFVLLVSACGQKGPLTVPEQPEQSPQKAAPQDDAKVQAQKEPAL